MSITRSVSCLLAASLFGVALSASTPTASAATAGCAAKAVAVGDRTTYPELASKALVGVASYNIKGQHAGGWTNWPARRNAIAAQIANCLPDVVGLQEASDSWVWETNSVSSARRISQYENATDEVNERTGATGDLYVPANRYRDYCSTTAEWNGRWQGQPAPWRQCLTDASKNPYDNRILFNSRTVRLISQGFSNLTHSSSTRRTVAWAILEQKATGRRFVVADTHLDLTVSEAYRVMQMKQARAVVAAHRVYGGVSLPTFLLGDFNVSRYTEGTTAPDVLTAAGWVDIVGNDRRVKATGTNVGWCRRRAPQAPSVPSAANRFVNSVYNTFSNTTYSCTYPEGNSAKPRLASSLWWQYNGIAIDYIFVSWGVRARTWETVVPAGSVNGIAKSPPSDHNMVMTWAYV